jgi:LmbE family N-acetylglucosaminyl deacetylase
MNIMVVAAHPDDEVLGCGGTMATLAKENNVIVAILGEGATSRDEDQTEAPDDAVSKLQKEARSAASILGVSEVVFGGLPDNRFDSRPLLDLIKIVEGWLEHFQPEVIYTHHGGDLNIDHTQTFRAVLTATRPMEGHSVRDLYSFEVASSTEWAFQSISPAFVPNTFADITNAIEQKINALAAYEGEVRPFPHPRSSDNLRATARKWGAASGFGYAEAFQLIRSIRTA